MGAKYLIFPLNQWSSFKYKKVIDFLLYLNELY